MYFNWTVYLLGIKYHHQVTLLALDFPDSKHSSLSSIISNRSSRQHSVSIQSCSMYVLIGQPALADLCAGVRGRMLFTSSSLFLQQCPACLVHLIWMVLEIGSRLPYNCCFMGCHFQDLFNIVCSILVQPLSSFFSICFVIVHVVHPCSSINTITTWEKFCFVLWHRFDFYMIDTVSIAVNAFTRHIFMSLSVDGILLPSYMNLSTNLVRRCLLLD